jgi:hypothetical protein
MGPGLLSRSRAPGGARVEISTPRIPSTQGVSCAFLELFFVVHSGLPFLHSRARIVHMTSTDSSTAWGFQRPSGSGSAGAACLGRPPADRAGEFGRDAVIEAGSGASPRAGCPHAGASPRWSRGTPAPPRHRRTLAGEGLRLEAVRPDVAYVEQLGHSSAWRRIPCPVGISHTPSPPTAVPTR